MTRKRPLTPKLDALVTQGLIRLTPDGFVGKASDGVEVSMGIEAAQVERYLAHNPSPDRW